MQKKGNNEDQSRHQETGNKTIEKINETKCLLFEMNKIDKPPAKP